jgi:hypothetical protein
MQSEAERGAHLDRGTPLMSDNIRSIRGAPVPPAEAVNEWHAAIAIAIGHGALRGVLVYETATGIGREPVGCGIATIEGLCRATLRDVTDGECG